MADQQTDLQVFNQTEISLPVDQSAFQDLLRAQAEKEGHSFNFVEVVYVDEQEIVRINQEHLDRDYVTDIITFRYDDAEDDGGIEGTLFCCAPRIIEQAKEFGESTEREFMRIYIHGLLHLLGYEDQSSSAKEQMTAKENTYLKLAGL